MGILVDVLIIGIIALCIWGGYRKGLIGVAFKILSFFVALVIALVLYKPVADFVIQNTSIQAMIENAIIENSQREDQEQIPEELNQEKISQETITSPIMVEYANKYIENAADKTKEVLAQEFAKSISIMLINVTSGILVFLIANIILIIIKAFSNLVAKLPIIKQFNKLGGILFGIIKGLLIVYVVLAILSLAEPVMQETTITNIMEQSYIGKIMYHHNMLLEILF